MVTIFACVRIVLGLRKRAPTEVVVGWFAIMLVTAVVVFALDRVLG